MPNSSGRDLPLPAELKQQIQQTYTQWLSSGNFKPRYGQKAMIAIIAKALFAIEIDEEGARIADCNDHLTLIEAGTGTGKTLAYAIAGILSAAALDKKLVVATATIALQEQLVHKDLPELLRAGLEFTFAIAKGRSRYVCLSKLKLQIESGQVGSDAALFPDEEPAIESDTLETFKHLYSEWQSAGWDGDSDNLPVPLEDTDWRLIAADRASCSGKKCPHYRNCSLFEARDRVRDADVIVANHDLVLADMAAGGGNILPEPEETVFIFDEAHHLPSKAQNHLSAKMSLSGEIKRLARFSKLLSRTPELLADSIAQSAYKPIAKTVLQVDETLDALLRSASSAIESLYRERASSVNAEGELRLVSGLVPVDIRELFQELCDCFRVKQRCVRQLMELMLQEFTPVQDSEQLAREAAYSTFGDDLARLDQVLGVCQAFASLDQGDAPPMARWFRLSQDAGMDISVHATPLSSASALTSLLWNRCFSAVLTSATLAALGKFDYFEKQVGISQQGNAFQIDGQLNFPQSTFFVPAMSSNPTQPDQHTFEIISLLPGLVSPGLGSLVLFSSRKQMEAVYAGLEPDLKERCLVQGNMSKNALIEKHKNNVDTGRQSVLMGLASFAEGLDLPGDYCVEVVIAKLPFAVPDSPVDEALGEWVEANGGSPFWDISVPGASIKLQQACGRLLRTESDVGRVSLLDSRIIRKSYGKSLLAALPPFELQLETR